MEKFKSKFSINEIGKFRFYSGIVIGILFSIILNSLFRLTLRLSNIGLEISDLNIRNIIDYQFSFYYLCLISFSSISFAFCFTTYLWMSKPRTTIRRKTLKLRSAQANSIWIFGGTLFFLTKMFTFFAGTEITIEKDFPYAGFVLPLFIYLYCWNLISIVFKSKKAFLISLLIYIITGFILHYF